MDTPATESPLSRQLREGVLALGLNRPAQRNALTPELYLALAQALADADTNAEVRCVLLFGHGAGFCAGNDIGQFAAHGASTEERPSAHFMRALMALRKPVVAAVEGHAVGIGATLLLHCDFVYAAQDAQLRFPFVQLGLCPEFASTLLLDQRVGHARAAELLLLGEPCGADQALQLGLVNAVFARGEVLPNATEIARRRARLPADALQTSKSLMLAGQTQACERQIAREREEFSRLLASDEAQAAFAAFLARRGAG